MLWIETGIAPPKAETIACAKELGAEVLHIPALIAEELQFELSLENIDCVFIGSPRAAKIAAKNLEAFKGQILAVGEGTAKALEAKQIHCKAFGDGTGAENFLFEIQEGKFNGVALAKRIVWISAEETAADLKALALKFGIEIQHVPVYRTTPNPIIRELVKQVVHPCKWILRSGKGVKALRQFFECEDSFEAIGKSAEIALESINKQD